MEVHIVQPVHNTEKADQIAAAGQQAAAQATAESYAHLAPQRAQGPLQAVRYQQEIAGRRERYDARVAAHDAQIAGGSSVAALKAAVAESVPEAQTQSTEAPTRSRRLEHLRLIQTAVAEAATQPGATAAPTQSRMKGPLNAPVVSATPQPVVLPDDPKDVRALAAALRENAGQRPVQSRFSRNELVLTNIRNDRQKPVNSVKEALQQVQGRFQGQRASHLASKIRTARSRGEASGEAFTRDCANHESAKRARDADPHSAALSEAVASALAELRPEEISGAFAETKETELIDTATAEAGETDISPVLVETPAAVDGASSPPLEVKSNATPSSTAPAAAAPQRKKRRTEGSVLSSLLDGY